jgi:hypothetical protein
MRYLFAAVPLVAILLFGCGGEAGHQQSAQIAPPAKPPADPVPLEQVLTPPRETELKDAVALNTPAATKEGGWGTIKGQIVFDGDKVPENSKLEVNKDQDHCLAKGPLLAESWVVNPKNKGVHWVAVFLKPERGKMLPVHPDLAKPSGDAVLDQPQCAFIPHVLAMRADQMLLVKNPAPVIHTVTLTGFDNQINETLPPNSEKKYQLRSERIPIGVSCAIHPWMKGYAWVFDHPYFAVTDADGKFEIKLAPAGMQNLVIWQESMGFLGGRAGANGRPIEVKPDGLTDLGVIKLKPSE